MNRPAELEQRTPNEIVSDPRLSRTVTALGRPSGRVSIVRWSTGLVGHLASVGDVAILLGSALVAGLASPVTKLFPTAFHMGAVTVAMTVMACYALSRLRAYSLLRLGQVVRPLLDAAAAVGGSLLVIEAALLITARTTPADQEFLCAWALLGFTSVAVVRQAERMLVAFGLRTGTLRRKVILIGATPQAEYLVRQLRTYDKFQPSKVVGIYDDRNATRRPAAIAGIPVEGDVDALCAYASDHPVDLIVIALPWQRAMEIFKLIQRVQWISSDVMIPMEEGTFNPRTASVAAVAGEPALQIARQPLQGARSLVKVVEDYAVAGLAVVLLSPLMAICAAAIKLDGPGPVFFRQTRVGFNNRTFRIVKFRTMSVDENDSGIVGTGKYNPRITRIGAILRRLSIDEIPQLFNVLGGNMSIVGPRPHVPGMLVGGEEYADAVREYAARHRIKPGITGLAQINGMRGGIHSISKARRGVELDMTYVEKWSLGLDIRIMARTLMVGMFGSKVF